jgi:linoleoyl-CoA desaturase
VAHHLFPSTHHFYYRKMNKVIYRHIREKQWSVSKTTFAGGVASHIRLLWNLGKIEHLRN